ncbi:hypothetical protein [Saccharothrix lopnurensis]|uniref:HTH cro/C1-type domain-containing protein n=1 Tax=Saccharothrix lopnurensis TaxID=1670621 RepID=A0ABW1P374_9PSEU
MPRTSAKTDGSAIRAIRVRRGLSVRDVVNQLEEQGVQLHEDHLRNIETGARKGAREELIAGLAHVLDVPVDSIASTA